MNKKQLDFLNSIGIKYDFSKKLSDDELSDLEERLGDFLTLEAVDENYIPTEQGLICEEILDLIDEL